MKLKETDVLEDELLTEKVHPYLKAGEKEVENTCSNTANWPITTANCCLLRRRLEDKSVPPWEPLTGSLPKCHPSWSLIELSYQQFSHQGPHG